MMPRKARKLLLGARKAQRAMLLLVATIATASVCSARLQAQPALSGMRIYAIDCGRLDYPDLD